MDTPAPGLPRGTVTFVFTDIEGSTDLARRHGADYGRVRSEHRRVLREAFGRHGGHEIDTAGDAFFVVFERARDAVAAVVDVQRALAGTHAVSVRIGVHSAEPYLDEEGYVGVGVHRAARICAAGNGGQILLSNATAGIVEDLGIEGVELRDLGEHRLKDIDRPQRLFQVVVDGLESEFPPLKSLDTAGSPSAVTTFLYADVMGWRAVLRSLGDERAAVVANAYHKLAGSEISGGGGRVLEGWQTRCSPASNGRWLPSTLPPGFASRSGASRGFPETSLPRCAWRSTPDAWPIRPGGTSARRSCVASGCATAGSPGRFSCRTRPKRCSRAS